MGIPKLPKHCSKPISDLVTFLKWNGGFWESELPPAEMEKIERGMYTGNHASLRDCEQLKRGCLFCYGYRKFMNLDSEWHSIFVCPYNVCFFFGREWGKSASLSQNSEQRSTVNSCSSGEHSIESPPGVQMFCKQLTGSAIAVAAAARRFPDPSHAAGHVDGDGGPGFAGAGDVRRRDPGRRAAVRRGLFSEPESGAIGPGSCLGEMRTYTRWKAWNCPFSCCGPLDFGPRCAWSDK